MGMKVMRPEYEGSWLWKIQQRTVTPWSAHLFEECPSWVPQRQASSGFHCLL